MMLDYIPRFIPVGIMVTLGMCLLSACYRTEKEWDDLRAISTCPIIPTGIFVVTSVIVVLLTWLTYWIFDL